MRTIRSAFAALLCLVLAACGGGGGGGGPQTPAGAFNLSATSASFAALQNAPLPASTTLSMTITGGNVAFVGAAYTNGQTQPSWLGIDITGSGANYSVVVSIRSTGIAPGDYSSTFSVGTADANGAVLRSQSITVSYSVAARVSISGQTQTYGFIYGDAVTAQNHPIAVVAPNRQWRISSDSAWLQVPDTTQSNSVTINGAMDIGALMPGQYQARVTVTNTANSQDAATAVVTVNIEAPTFSVTHDSILLGGDDGLSSAPQNLSFALGAGAAAHPFTLELSTNSGGGWLDASATSGVVGATGVTLQLSGHRTNLTGGSYTGQVRVTATVRSLVFTEVLPVTFNIEASRLVVGAAGVALSSSPAPARSVLTRNVTVFSSIDRNDVPWQASSDQSWLTVTGSGVTGQAVTLSANPAGLAADTTHFATVTVTSPDSMVENAETIRVGFHINSAAPADLSNTMTAQFAAASPVEPIVFINDGGPDVIGYDVYTGVAVRPFTNVVASAGVMVVSDDGARLYIYDRTNLRVTELNATTGALVRHYNSGTLYSTTPWGGGLTFFRPSGYPILITPSSRMYDVASNTEYVTQSFTAPLTAASLDPSVDSRHVTTDGGAIYRFNRTALNGGQLNVSNLFSASTAQGRTGQACISADRTLVYTASGAPYEFPGTSLLTRQVAQVLPGTNYPNSILCLWNGVVIGGVDGYYAAADVWIYNGPTGQELTRRSSSAAPDYRSLVDRGMAASGDATRLITLTESTPGANQAQEVRFQSIPGP